MYSELYPSIYVYISIFLNLIIYIYRSIYLFLSINKYLPIYLSIINYFDDKINYNQASLLLRTTATF